MDLHEDKTVPVEEQVLPAPKAVIGKEEISKALTILQEYKEGKTALEKRLIEDELWWEVRHWEAVRPDSMKGGPKPASAWLFNTITSTHADAMDNYPEPVVLPREKDDEETAKTLSAVLPVIMEYNDFEATYSENWWEKLKHGTGAYFVGWDADKDNGLGDVDIHAVDLLRLYWEPGVRDIQDSRNVFVLDLVDNDVLVGMYPHLKGKLANGGGIDIAQYNYDDKVDTSKKSVVIDWYYKKQMGTRTLVHLVKFVAGVDEPLYSSEDSELAESGLYEHGKYPFVLDTLYPEKGTPVGFGLIAICKDPQINIDALNANILESSLLCTKKRWLVPQDVGINLEEFADNSKPFIHVNGHFDKDRMEELVMRPLDPVYLNLVQYWADEMRETSGNRDVNGGGAPSGVTAAAAIAALQEAGNKLSRDMISGSYRAYVDIGEMVIDVLRQFYKTGRSFRVAGDIPGTYDFTDLSGEALALQVTGQDAMGQLTYRQPVFDLKIKAQKKNPFSRMEQNERAKELYAMGFFNPDKAQESLVALDMMDFEGKDKIVEQVQQGQTLMNLLMEMGARMDQMAAMMGMAVNTPPAAPGQPQGEAPGGGISTAAAQAQRPKQSYAQRLAQRSKPSMDSVPSGATPK